MNEHSGAFFNTRGYSCVWLQVTISQQHSPCTVHLFEKTLDLGCGSLTIVSSCARTTSCTSRLSPAWNSRSLVNTSDSVIAAIFCHSFWTVISMYFIVFLCVLCGFEKYLDVSLSSRLKNVEGSPWFVMSTSRRHTTSHDQVMKRHEVWQVWSILKRRCKDFSRPVCQANRRWNRRATSWCKPNWGTPRGDTCSNCTRSWHDMPWLSIRLVTLSEYPKKIWKEHRVLRVNRHWIRKILTRHLFGHTVHTISVFLLSTTLSTNYFRSEDMLNGMHGKNVEKIDSAKNTGIGWNTGIPEYESS